jgi:hypothetical protein
MFSPLRSNTVAAQPAPLGGCSPVSNAVAPPAPAPPTIPVPAGSPAGAADPLDLLSEAVQQLKVAVAALGDSQAAPTPTLTPAPAAPGVAPAANLEAAIAATQREIAAYLDSRRNGAFGSTGFAAFSDAAVPFSTASLANEQAFFAEQTSEPEL